MDWIDLAQNRDSWRAVVVKIRVPNCVESFLTSRETVSFSGRTMLHGDSRNSLQAVR